MTYKELKRQIQNINIAYDKQLIVSHNEQYVTIRDDDNWFYATISNRVPYALHTACIAFEHLETNLRHDLLKAIYEFVQTPIDARNLSPKYYISSKLTPDRINRFLFKEFNNIDCLGWGYKDGGNTEFTQKEIDYICDKFHTNLSDFNIEEVEE